MFDVDAGAIVVLAHRRDLEPRFDLRSVEANRLVAPEQDVSEAEGVGKGGRESVVDARRGGPGHGDASGGQAGAQQLEISERVQVARVGARRPQGVRFDDVEGAPAAHDVGASVTVHLGDARIRQHGLESGVGGEPRPFAQRRQLRADDLDAGDARDVQASRQGEQRVGGSEPDDGGLSRRGMDERRQGPQGAVDVAERNPALPDAIQKDGRPARIGLEDGQARGVLRPHDPLVGQGPVQPSPQPRAVGHRQRRRDAGDRRGERRGLSPRRRAAAGEDGQPREHPAARGEQLEGAGRTQVGQRDPAGEDRSGRAAGDVREQHGPDARADVPEIDQRDLLQERKTGAHRDGGWTDQQRRQQEVQAQEPRAVCARLRRRSRGSRTRTRHRAVRSFRNRSRAPTAAARSAAATPAPSRSRRHTARRTPAAAGTPGPAAAHCARGCSRPPPPRRGRRGRLSAASRR